MNYKQVKRKCNVRGCKNTASFHISRTREIGNSVIICKECLQEALTAISERTGCTEPTEKKQLSETINNDQLKASVRNSRKKKKGGSDEKSFYVDMLS